MTRLFFWGAHAPRVPISAPRRNDSLVRSKKVVGEAPTTAREARALPSLFPDRECKPAIVRRLFGLPNRTADGMIIVRDECSIATSR